MPIDIREQVAILEAAVLKFHWLCLGRSNVPRSLAIACRHAELDLEVAATKWRSSKALAKQGSRRANRVH